MKIILDAMQTKVPSNDYKNKNKGKDQKAMQSSTTPDPRHRMGK